MQGLMRHYPLLVSSLLEYAAQNHAGAEIVSYERGMPAHRCGYPDLDRRARQLAKALGALGIREG